MILLTTTANLTTALVIKNKKTPNNESEKNISNYDSGIVFEPPYTSNGTWVYDHNYLVKKLKLVARHETGFISAYTESYIAGWAQGGAYVTQFIYIGKKKEITVSAEIKCAHNVGKFGFLPSGVSTSKEMGIGSKWWSVELDKFWNYKMFLDVFLSVLKILFPWAEVKTIIDVINFMSKIEDILAVYEVMETLEERGEAETIYMNRTKTVSKGLIPISVGVSSCAASAASYTAAVAIGQVVSISVYGVDPPNPATITGPHKGKVNVMHNFTAVAEDKNNDDLQYKFIWGDGTESQWSELVPSGTPVTMSHSYSKKGKYTIKVEVRDNDYDSEYNPTMKSISEGFNIEIKHNFPPYQLSIDGPRQVKTGETATYYSTALEPDNDPIYYQFDWFGEQTKWLGPYKQGETISITHSWEDKGLKLVCVRAIDDPNHDGDPSDGWATEWECLSVEVPHEKNNLPLLKELLHKHLFFSSTLLNSYISKKQ